MPSTQKHPRMTPEEALNEYNRQTDVYSNLLRTSEFARGVVPNEMLAIIDERITRAHRFNRMLSNRKRGQSR
jgi:hypothetical protein